MPAGLPGVELGEFWFKHVELLSIPLLTTENTLPAVPLPRLSPPTNINVVPPLTFVTQENPVPCSGTWVIGPAGIAKL